VLRDAQRERLVDAAIDVGELEVQVPEGCGEGDVGSESDEREAYLRRSAARSICPRNRTVVRTICNAN